MKNLDAARKLSADASICDLDVPANCPQMHLWDLNAVCPLHLGAVFG